MKIKKYLKVHKFLYIGIKEETGEILFEGDIFYDSVPKNLMDRKIKIVFTDLAYVNRYNIPGDRKIKPVQTIYVKKQKEKKRR